MDKEEIISAIEKHFALTGRAPSVRQLREQLGSGSLNRLCLILREWKEAHSEEIDSRSIPQFTERQKEMILATLWKVCEPIIQTRAQQLAEEMVMRMDVPTVTAPDESKPEEYLIRQEQIIQLEKEIQTLQGEFIEKQLILNRLKHFYPPKKN